MGKTVIIRIAKRGRRNQMTCFRPDGSRETSDLGPNLPHHDLAHYVVESRLGLRKGFFGNIAGGYTVAQLSDKDVIRGLSADSARAEILARALQSLSTGACAPEQFDELVNTELAHWSLPAIVLSRQDVAAMSSEFTTLLERFEGVRDGDSLQLDFAVAG